jgi:hypothetical protein
MPVFIPCQRFATELRSRGMILIRRISEGSSQTRLIQSPAGPECALVRTIAGGAVMVSANMIALIILILVILATSCGSPLIRERLLIIHVPPLREFKEPRWHGSNER